VHFALQLKVHKHEIFLNFWGAKSKPYMPLVHIRKNFDYFISILSVPYCISIFENFVVGCAYAATVFCEISIQKFIMVIFVLFDGFLVGFSKFGFFVFENRD
jgi:hypothetical protein